jgi:restriction system protein
MCAARIWAIRAGSAGQADRVFLEDRQIALSFVEIGGEVADLPACRDAFKEILADTSAGIERPEAVPAQAGQLFRFVHEMRIGDRVLYPRKIDRTLHWGEVSGPYVFHPDHEGGFTHRRNVVWKNQLSRDVFSAGSLYEAGSALSLFEVKSFADEFRRKFEGGVARPEPVVDTTNEGVVRDITETTRDFISKKMKTHLKGFPMEPFVADLFRAMGYRAHATRRTKDDGIDVVAHRDELGIEPPILKIQVKTQDGNVGSDAVKAFSAMVPDRDVGIVVATSDYTAAALDFAKTKSNLRLLNGIELVELVQKYYDQLDPKYRQQIPLRRVLVPDVAIEAE